MSSPSSKHAPARGIFAIVDNQRLLVVIPKSNAANYFEPPPYHVEAEVDAILMHLPLDMQTVLAMTDAVFELDYRTREFNQAMQLVDNGRAS